MSWKEAAKAAKAKFRGDSNEIQIKNIIQVFTDDQVEEFCSSDEAIQFFEASNRDAPQDRCDLETELSNIDEDDLQKLLNLLLD